MYIIKLLVRSIFFVGSVYSSYLECVVWSHHIHAIRSKAFSKLSFLQHNITWVTVKHKLRPSPINAWSDPSWSKVLAFWTVSSIVGAADYPKISDADWSIQIFSWNGPISIAYCIFRSNYVGYPRYMLTIEFPKNTNMGFDQSES